MRRLYSPRRFLRRGHHVLDREAEMLQQHVDRTDSPKPFMPMNRPTRAKILAPALIDAHLDAHPGRHRRRQHRIAILGRLRVEQFANSAD